MYMSRIEIAEGLLSAYRGHSHGKIRHMKSMLALLLVAVLSTSIAPAFASDKSQASGSFLDTAVLSSEVTQSGATLIFDQTNAGTITGTLSGSYVTVVHLTLNLLTGKAVYEALDTCTCIVDGKLGTLSFQEHGTITLGYQLNSQATTEGGTNQLVNLNGKIILQGFVFTASGLTMGTYAGEIWSDSND